MRKKSRDGKSVRTDQTFDVLLSCNLSTSWLLNRSTGPKSLVRPQNEPDFEILMYSFHLVKFGVLLSFNQWFELFKRISQGPFEQRKTTDAFRTYNSVPPKQQNLYTKNKLHSKERECCCSSCSALPTILTQIKILFTIFLLLCFCIVSFTLYIHRKLKHKQRWITNRAHTSHSDTVLIWNTNLLYTILMVVF